MKMNKQFTESEKKELCQAFVDLMVNGSRQEIEEFWDNGDDVFFKSTRQAIHKCLDEPRDEEGLAETVNSSILDYYNETGDRDAFDVLKISNIVFKNKKGIDY